MQKQAPTLGRLIVMVGFALSCFGLLLYIWLAFGGSIPLAPKGYRVTAAFPEATTLAQEADVRISGVPVGKVRQIGLGTDNRTDAVLEIDAKYAPLPNDVRAILRQKTLLGETYVELTPGTPGAPTLPEGGRIPNGQISEAVQVDEIVRSFDAKTRAAFQVWQQSLALSVDGRGRDLNVAFGTLAPLAENGNELLKILNSQEGAVRRLVRDTGVVSNALSERQGQLRGLITNANTVFRTTALRNEQLREAFIALPTFERESRATVTRLTQFAEDTNPLITQLQPAARELSPTLIELARVAPDLENFFVGLGPLITASKKGLPGLQTFLKNTPPLLGQLDPLLRNINPPLQGLGAYLGELVAFFANSAAATQATDLPTSSRVPVHYLRSTNPVGPHNLAAYPTRQNWNRASAYTYLGEIFRTLGSGLPVFDARNCAPLAFPTLVTNTALIPADLQALINEFFLNDGVAAAPPCKQQSVLPNLGFPPTPPTGQYPHVQEEAP